MKGFIKSFGPILGLIPADLIILLVNPLAGCIVYVIEMLLYFAWLIHDSKINP